MPAGGSTLTRLDEHPTVRKVQGRAAPEPEPVLDGGTLLRECLDLGADDAGFVEIERAEIADQREEILALLPRARTLIGFLVRMNREAIRSPARSLANVEFHHAGDEVNEVGRRLASRLERRGIRAVNATMGFPMETDRWPRKMWTVSHKPVAQAADWGGSGSTAT